MLSALKTVLGKDSASLYRYLSWLLCYALLNGLLILLFLHLLEQLWLTSDDHLLRNLGLLLLSSILSWACRYQVEKAGIAVGITFIQKTRLQLAEHAAKLPVGWFNHHNKALFQHTSMQGLMTIAQLPAHVLTPVLHAVLSAIFLAMVLWCYYGVLGLIAVVSLVALYWVFQLSSKISAYADRHYRYQFAQSSQKIVEFAQTQSVLRAFSGQQTPQHAVQQAIAQQQQAGFKLILCSCVAAVLNMWYIQVIFALLLSVALHQSIIPSEPLQWSQIFSLALAMLLIYRFIEPLLEVASYHDFMRHARGQLKVIQDIFATPTLPEPSQAIHPKDASIVLNAVSFRYPEAKTAALQDIQLEIAAGSMLALIGQSGAGKTTLVQLIARFFDVNQGQILIGGADLRQIASPELAQQISQIFQDNYLFAGSIADNIRIGHPEASAAQMQQAIALSGVSEIIARLPQGLDSPVGEGGVGLSGGERQRISIARALLKDAPILLVDEATSALDAEHQAMISSLLTKLKGQRTLVVIAHQLSSIAMADQIVVLEQGKIIQQGRPDQLAQQSGLYAQLLAQQQTYQAETTPPKG